MNTFRRRRRTKGSIANSSKLIALILCMAFLTAACAKNQSVTGKLDPDNPVSIEI